MKQDKCRTEKNEKQRRVIKEQERRILHVYQLRHQFPTHKLVEVTPVYGHGTHGKIVACRVDIDLPVAA